MEFTLKNKTVCLCGKRGSGKTILAKELIENEKHLFSNIFLFSPTEKLNHDYKDLIKASHIFDNWSDKWCKMLFEKLTSVPKTELKHTLLVFDDMGSESSMDNSKEFIKLFTRGRHLNIAVLSLNQYLYQLPKICRSNLDYLLVSQQNAQSVEILEDEFNNSNLTPAEFKKIYYQSTSNFYFMLINCNTIKDNGDLNQLYGRLKANV